MLQLCASYGFVPQVVHESKNVSSILQLINDGLGASILPTSFVKNNLKEELGFLELTSSNQSPQESPSVISEKAIDFLKKRS
ncbi:LysR family transcriptional regulator substrate-binding protein [Solitalea sp. MAHUQ-68]|uniref:LysR family transcriptional regulator substrate-binding protein n=1 Tax=Solitalea agri TaxID=2953739 RepID=A0A9X2EZQ7_9SPHI|nr:LysR family transcriptional regulator substrate-binding protein [Solitalea agri]